MTMKTILITGSTDGIGKLTALQLAKEGHAVLLHGRNADKLKSVHQEMQSLSTTQQPNYIIGDLSNFESIKSIVNQLKSQNYSIDVLINNAGVFKSTQRTNKDGLELRFVVNYLAPYILTNAILAIDKKSSLQRVINLSSAAQASISYQAMLGKESVSEQSAYAQSKLALIMWSFAFAKAHPNITTIAVNPGSLLNTKMVQEAYGQFWAPAEKGASILYDLATSEDYNQSSGLYWDNDLGDFNKAHEDAYDETKLATLLSETENILNL